MTESNGVGGFDEEMKAAIANSSVTNTNDEQHINSRLFVGNLAGDLATKPEDLFRKFRKHGEISGVSIHGRFSFVQFKEQASAEAAKAGENGNDLRGSPLEVRLAKDGRKPQRNKGRSERDSEVRPSNAVRRIRGRRSRSYSRSPPRRPRRPSRSRSPAHYRSAPVPALPTVLPIHMPPRPDVPNDVEIVATRRNLQDYVKLVETRVRDLLLTTGVIWLHDDAPFKEAIDDMGERGVKYVVLIVGKHERDQNMSLFMFHHRGAQPTVHRGCPLPDGLRYIMSDMRTQHPFELRQRELEAQGPGFFPIPPPDVEYNLKLLSERRFVSSKEFDKIISTLEEWKTRSASAHGLPLPTTQPVKTDPASALASDPATIASMVKILANIQQQQPQHQPVAEVAAPQPQRQKLDPYSPRPVQQQQRQTTQPSLYSNGASNKREEPMYASESPRYSSPASRPVQRQATTGNRNVGMKQNLYAEQFRSTASYPEEYTDDIQDLGGYSDYVNYSSRTNTSQSNFGSSNTGNSYSRRF